MTLQEWQLNPELAAELKKALDLPIVKAAIEILEKDTMAKRLNNSALLQITNTGTALGYDVGRASILQDLVSLSSPVETLQQLQPTYSEKE